MTILVLLPVPKISMRKTKNITGIISSACVFHSLVRKQGVLVLKEAVLAVCSIRVNKRGLIVYHQEQISRIIIVQSLGEFQRQISVTKTRGHPLYLQVLIA